jgi:pimeloyl-ACP methyl ester carboxylesterase
MQHGTRTWKSVPTWFLIADGDQAIPPAAQRQFAARMGATTTEIASNHGAMVSHPEEALKIITAAAAAVSTAN